MDLGSRSFSFRSSLDDIPSEIPEVGGRSNDVGFGTGMMTQNVENCEKEFEESERPPESHLDSEETEYGDPEETESAGELVEDLVGEEMMSHTNTGTSK